MTALLKPVRRQILCQYKHYRRPIVVMLYSNTISLWLKGTRTRYEIPIPHLLDDLCRREARRIQAEKRARRKLSKIRKAKAGGNGEQPEIHGEERVL
jgi:hypothetical protein